MKHKGFCTWGIQTETFAACSADFVPKFFHLPDLYTRESNSLFPQKRRGWKWRKGDSLKSEWNTRVSVLGAFKLDHFQPVKLILLQNFSTFLIFIIGSPIPYYPREGKRGKGNPLEMNEKEDPRVPWISKKMTPKCVLSWENLNCTMCSRL